MTQPESSPALNIIKGSELPLSGQVLVELMRAVLTKGAPFRFRARGWSMAPFIRDGDIICVSPLPEAGPAMGEVVAFIRAGTGQLVVHRVIGRERGAYAIQGDNTPGKADATVSQEDILGRVTRITRNGKDVRLGLGPERRLIAALSRAG